MEGKGLEIVRPLQLQGDLIEYLNTGAKRGIELTEWPVFNEHYTMAEGTCTDWTGFPLSGKTVLLFNLLILASRRHGWRHLLYVPDAGNKIEVTADLVNIYTGRSFSYRPKITEPEIEKALEFIDYHFRIIEKTDLKAKLTPVQFFDMVAEYAVKHKGFKTGVIDAWKDLYHDDSEYRREDKYLEDVLSYRNALAEREGLHFHTVIHPTKPQRQDGVIKPPTAYDMKGGSEWYNNAKNIIAVHRPSFDDTRVEIHIRKVKPRAIGKVGMIEAYFDWKALRYIWTDTAGVQRYLNGEPVEATLFNLNSSDQEKGLPF